MKIRYPIRKADGREYKHYDELMTDMKKMDHGWWLVGVNRYWHGGVHVGDTSSPASVLSQETPEKSVPLQCMADGEVVAWRVCRDYTQALLYENHAEKMELRHSPTFLLVKSVYHPDTENPEGGLDLYHLYMQMAPLSEYPKRKLYRVTEKGHGVRCRRHSKGDDERELAPDVIKDKHGLPQALNRGSVLAMLHKTSFTLKGKTEPFGLVQKITHGKPEGPLFWVSMRPEFMVPDGECYVCLPVWMHHALNHGVFDEVVLPPTPLKVAIKAGDAVGFLGAQDISENGYTRESRTEYKAHIELLSPDAHVPDVLANIKDIKSGAQYVKLKLKKPFYLRNGDGDDATFSPMSAITRKDGDMILRREATHPFTDRAGVVWFQIRPHTWMHQDDVEQLSQHDLTQLNFTTIVAEPTTDFSRPLDENWVTEAVKSLASHFDAEKGPDSAQAKTFFDGLLGQLRVRNAGGMTEWDSNELNKRLFAVLHSSQMNLPELTRRLVVQHDSDWHGGSENSRWSRLFGDGWDPMNGVNKLFLRDHEWMSKVPPFMEGKPVWHFHPLEFLEAIRQENYDFSTREGTIHAIISECRIQGITLNTQIAYVLATVKRETGNTFKPVKEGDWIGHSSSDEFRKNNFRYYPYYGRGYVQITWDYNYKKYSEKLGIDLLNEPDLALEPNNALFILVDGFKFGVFSGKKITDYVNEKKTDFYNARRCINGLDHAEEIKSFAEEFLIDLDNGSLS
ncbi:glycoside hydrolase family 19 protein [Yersinia mollaretii]|uniref:glycoside hydrolase family 19 protein n=1 Tax=Yersinia mollaretii TaxID=33060 RepID=UPI00069EBF65|nr:glycoside hydrolase family 19 protein [Yersinia mollaretii]